MKISDINALNNLCLTSVNYLLTFAIKSLMKENRDQVFNMNIDRQMRIISISDLIRKLKSKSALYTILTVHCRCSV